MNDFTTQEPKTITLLAGNTAVHITVTPGDGETVMNLEAYDELLEAGDSEGIVISEDFADEAEIVRGTVDLAGQPVSSTNRLRIDNLLDVVPGATYRIDCNLQTSVLQYQNSDSTYLNITTGFKNSPFEFTTDENCQKIRAIFRMENNSNIVVDDMQYLSLKRKR